jgi:hypothetical protein
MNITEYHIININPGPEETTGSDNPLPGIVNLLIDLGFIDSHNLENIPINLS